MEYNFNKTVNRRNTDSLKWNICAEELPMWVADMDFQTAPEIIAAIKERASHGVFGYTVIPDTWYSAYTDWWDHRHRFQMQKEWLIFCTGVVPAISSIVRKITTPAEKVLIQTPVYNIFYNSVLNNGRVILESPLIYDGVSYGIDFDDLDKKLSDHQTTLMILCNPHNPIGKIWDMQTLNRIGEMCKKYNVTVISDEIHCDLCDPLKEYIPFASVSETCRDISITCIAPTKAFNLAGIQTAAICIPNEALRHKVNRALNTDEVAEPNCFAVTAAVSAFTRGEKWLDELREYIFENKCFVREFLKNEIPVIKALPSEATYLLWLDCQRLTDSNSSELACYIREKSGLYLSSGHQYGGNGGGFLRMNIACPRILLEDGLNRLKASVNALENK